MDGNLSPETYPQIAADLLIFFVPKLLNLWDVVHDLLVDYFQQP